MGNYIYGKLDSSSRPNEDLLNGLAHDCKISKLCTLDPRSPTEGIIRTPIHADELYYDKYIDPRSPTVGVTRTPLDQKKAKVKGNFYFL